MRVLENTPIVARLCLAAASSVMTANLTAKRPVGCAAARTEADVIALMTCTYAPSWTQTVDQHRVRKPMLYPLSYGGQGRLRLVGRLGEKGHDLRTERVGGT